LTESRLIEDSRNSQLLTVVTVHVTDDSYNTQVQKAMHSINDHKDTQAVIVYNKRYR